MPAKETKRIDRHVGNRIRMRRIMLDSQERLGERLDLSFQHFHKYEKGIDRGRSAILLYAEKSRRRNARPAL